MKLSYDGKITAKTAAIAAVLIVVAAGVGYLAADNYGKSATVHIEIQSVHPLQDVSVQVYADGKMIKSIENLSPLEKITVDYRHSFGILKDSSLIKIKTVSVAAIGGSTVLERELIVFDKGEYTQLMPV